MSVNGPKQPGNEDITQFTEDLLEVLDEHEDSFTKTQLAELFGMFTSVVFTGAQNEEPTFSSDMTFIEFAAYILHRNTRHVERMERERE